MACKLTLHHLSQLSGLVKNWRDLAPVQLSYIKWFTVLLRLESIDFITRRGRCFWCFWVHSTNFCFYRRHRVYIIHVDSKIWSLMWFFFLLDCCSNCRFDTLRRATIRVLAAIWWWCKAKLVVLSEIIVYNVILGGDAFELSCEAEVANPNCAVLKDKQVGGFDVTMDDTSWVDILKAT